MKRIYWLLIKFSLCFSLDPSFHSNNMMYLDGCKGNGCISIIIKYNRENIIGIMSHYLFRGILWSQFMHDMYSGMIMEKILLK